MPMRLSNGCSVAPGSIPFLVQFFSLASLRLSIASLACVLLGGCALPRPDVPPPADTLHERLDAYLAARAAEGFSGVVLVEVDGRRVLREAYGPGIAPTTAFWIGSLSKPFTAAAILHLRDTGRLSLADSLARFFEDVPGDKRAVTVRHLLTHTSGLADGYVADDVPDRDEAVRTILSVPLDRDPGTGYGYTSDGYALLAAIIEGVSGEAFETYLQEHVLGPAEMTQTGFWGAPHPGGPLAPVARPVPLDGWGFKGGTGMSSTADDLLRWHRAMRSDAVLSTRTWEEATAPQAVRPETRAYGYGWHILQTSRGTRLVVHTGAESELEHHAALYRFVDEDVVVIVLSNAEEDTVVEVRRGVLGILFPG